MSTSLDVIVVGAGQAGLAAGYHLRRARLSFAILEAAEGAGGSWSRYYDSLRLFSPARYSSLPELAFPGDPDDYPVRDEVAAYLRAYAERFNLPVVGNSRVLHVDRDGQDFTVETEAGQTYQSRSVIAATGSFSQPNRPVFPGQDAFRGEMLHAADYRTPAPYAGKRVVVVGAGNSAVQIAAELAEVAHVSLATRQPVKFVPQRLVSRDIHFWLSVTGVDRFPLGQWTELTEPTAVIDTGRYGQAISSGSPDRRPMFARMTGRGVVWADGIEEEIDAVILATGYRPNLDFLDRLGALRADGSPDQRAGLSRTVPGLAFVGLSGQRSLASATLRGVGRDARYVVTRLARYLQSSRFRGMPAASIPSNFATADVARRATPATDTRGR